MAVKKKPGGSKKPKPTRSETLGLRLDPRMKFALELLARSQRRSISGTVEWCVERIMRSESIEVLGFEVTFEELTWRVWDVDPIRQLVNLCALAPKLATFEELQTYRVMELTDRLWCSPNAPKDANNLIEIEEPLELLHAVQTVVKSGKLRALNDNELLPAMGVPF